MRIEQERLRAPDLDFPLPYPTPPVRKLLRPFGPAPQRHHMEGV